MQKIINHLNLILIICLAHSVISYASPDNFIAIMGEYSNSRGDTLSVNSTDGMFEGIFTQSDSYNEYYFTEDDLVVTNDNTYTFSPSESDCDHPGCLTFTGQIIFKKNKRGSYYVVAEFDVEEDVEDLSMSFEDLLDQGLDSEQISQALDSECESYYSSEITKAYLVDFVEDYKNSVYCGYKIKSFLKKTN